MFRLTHSLPLVAYLSVLLAAHPGYAQLPGSDSDAQPLLPWSAFADDPIGLDPEAVRQQRPKRDSPQSDQEASAPGAISADLSFGPKPRHGRARVGEVLTAMPSVREVFHQQTVTFKDGLARVDVHLRFENSVAEPAEVLYRLSIPKGAHLAQLKVCIEARCRAGMEVTSDKRFSAYDAALLARAPAGAELSSLPILPIAQADLTTDKRGPFLRIQAAPVKAGHPLEVYVSYAVEAPTHHGTTRLFLPARGMDPRVAPANVLVHGGDLVAPRIDGLDVDAERTLEVPPWAPVSTEASLATSSKPSFHIDTFRCGHKHCARVFSRTPPERAGTQARASHLILALDVSPSMAGPARNRLPAALKALLDATPQRTTLQALRFASHAETVLKEPTFPHNFQRQALGNLLEPPDLGSATRLRSAIELAATLATDSRLKRNKIRLVVLGDGQLTTGSSDIMRAVRQAGFSLTLVNLSDTPVSSELVAKLRKAQIIEAGATARSVEVYGATGAWQERMASIFAPTALQAGKCTWHQGREQGQKPGQKKAQTQRLAPVTAGESQRLRLTQAQPFRKLRCHRGPLRAKVRSMAARRESAERALIAVDRADLHRPCTDFPNAPRWLPKRKSEARSCDRRGPAQRVSGINGDDKPIIQARARTCAPVPKPSESDDGLTMGKGMPAEPLREMLRMRIIPAARECFRKDRAGRADYSVRAVFRFELANQEVVHSAVEGRIERRLRNCLLTAVDRLHVPRFSGRVKVTYPLRTISEAVPPRIELSGDTSNRVDTLLAE